MLLELQAQACHQQDPISKVLVGLFMSKHGVAEQSDFLGAERLQCKGVIGVSCHAVLDHVATHETPDDLLTAGSCDSPAVAEAPRVPGPGLPPAGFNIKGSSGIVHVKTQSGRTVRFPGSREAEQCKGVFIVSSHAVLEHVATHETPGDSTSCCGSK